MRLRIAFKCRQNDIITYKTGCILNVTYFINTREKGGLAD